MLTKIGSPDNVPEYIEKVRVREDAQADRQKVKRKEAVLSGFGHRICA